MPRSILLYNHDQRHFVIWFKVSALIKWDEDVMKLLISFSFLCFEKSLSLIEFPSTQKGMSRALASIMVVGHRIAATEIYRANLLRAIDTPPKILTSLVGNNSLSLQCLPKSLCETPLGSCRKMFFEDNCFPVLNTCCFSAASRAWPAFNASLVVKLGYSDQVSHMNKSRSKRFPRMNISVSRTWTAGWHKLLPFLLHGKNVLLSKLLQVYYEFCHAWLLHRHARKLKTHGHRKCPVYLLCIIYVSHGTMDVYS